MKSVYAAGLLSLFVASNAMAIAALPSENYTCGPLKYKGEDTVSKSAPVFGVSLNPKSGVKLIKAKVGEDSEEIPMKLQMSTAGTANYQGGDYKVTITRLGSGKTVKVSKVANSDYAAECKRLKPRR